MASKKSSANIKKIRGNFKEMVSDLWKAIKKSWTDSKYLKTFFSLIGCLCVLWVWAIIEFLILGYKISNGIFEAVKKAK
jgi:hypothetical protein